MNGPLFSFSWYCSMRHWQTQTFIAVSILVMIGAAIFAFWTYTWVSLATVVDGQVTEVVTRFVNGQRSYAPRVTYQLDNQLHEFVSMIASTYPPQFEVGESVKVLVSRDREQEAIGSFFQLYGLPMILFLGGLVLAVEMAIIQAGDQLLYFLHPKLKDD